MNLRSTVLRSRKENPFGVWALTIVTLGIYYLVWYYKVNKEMRQTYGIDVDPAVAVIAITFGGIIIVPPFVSTYKTGRRVEQTQFKADVRDTVSPVLSFILWFIFGLHVIYLQSNLNRVWEQSGRSLPESTASGHPSPAEKPPPAPPPPRPAGEGGPS